MPDFANDDGGLAGFKEYLAQLPDVPVHIMVDAVEEDYRFETLPHAFGARPRADGRAQAEAALPQHAVLTAWLLGRDTGKRRDDRYLFSALTNPELVTDWLQAIVARGLPVAGVYLLPMVSAALLEKLERRRPPTCCSSRSTPAACGSRSSATGSSASRRLTRGESGRADNRGALFRRGNLEHPALPARAAHR